jgi:excisionase family DNA binding protein
VQLVYKGKAKTQRSRIRSFERWKQDVRGLPRTAFVPVSLEVEEWSRFHRGLKPGALYAIDLPLLRAGLADAAGRRDRLKAAWEQLAGRPWHYEPPGKRFRPLSMAGRRTQTVAQVAEELGVAKPVIYSWIRRHGLPHDRKEGERILLNLEEVKEWANLRERRGIRVATSEDVRERVPIGVAAPRMREVRDYLGLSNERMAELIGVETSTLAQWLAKRTEREKRSIPVSALERAEDLLNTEIARSTRTTKTQRITASDVETALADNRGMVTHAARALGISLEAFRKVAADLGVRYGERLPVEDARPRLLAVRNHLRLANQYYADLLGVPKVTLNTWLGLGGRWRDIETIPRAAVETAEGLLGTMQPRVFQEARYQRVTREEVEQAWEEGGRTVKGAARAMGVGPEGFRRLAESRGVDIPAPLVARITKRDLQALLKRHKGVRASMARELGVSAPYVTMLLGRTR